MRDIAYTASIRRSHHSFRGAVVGASREEWIAALERFAERPARSSPANHPSGLTFVYSGQGPQWPGMGLELFRSEPVFRARLESAEVEVRRLAGWSLLEALGGPEAEARLRRTDVAQPALLALQAGLTDLLRAWGIEPEAVLGHSAGEAGAAYAAGALSFEDALRVALERGRFMQAAAGRGAMAAVELPLEEAERVLAPYGGGLEVASVNSPTSTVISGEAEPLRALLAFLEARGVYGKQLDMGFAFHSRQMEPFQKDLTHALSGLRPSPPRLALFSTVTGRRAEDGDYGAAYWARNIRERVRFAEAIAACAGEGHEVFLEIGPHPVLAPMIRRCGAALDRALVPLASLQREEDDVKAMLEAVGGLYRLSHAVDWSRCCRPGGRAVRLPTYPWQRKRFWLDGGRVASPADAPVEAAVKTETKALDELTYGVAWPHQERRTPPIRPAQRPGTWLILADRGGVGAALADLLRGRGETCVTVFTGQSYRASREGCLVVDPSSAEDLLRLLREEWKSNGVPRRGVVHLWSLDAPAGEETTPASLEAAHALGCVSALHLVRALATSGGPRLWLVTRGAQAAGAAPSAVAVAQAPLWGFGRVLALEQPECWGGLVDLDPGASGDEPQRLLDEIAEPDGEDQLAFRGAERRVARLVREPLGGEVAARLSEGSYLVTGGLGGLGLQVARWMVERGARHLVLTSRAGLPARSRWDELPGDGDARERVEAVRALEALGASVVVAAADVSDPAAMASVFEAFGQTLPPLRGVVHAAGVATVAALAGLEASALLEVLRPKVTGAWVLHELTRKLRLDFFVLFSSAAAVWGSKGLGHYAAANQFLDALAQHRHARGLPALSVNWGWWSGGGMASAATGAFFRRAGVEELSKAQALDALGRLLGSGDVQKTVAAVEWKVFKPAYEARGRRPLLERIETVGARGGHEPAAEDRDLRDSLADAPPERRRELLVARLAREVALLLGVDADETIDPRQGFFRLGMDSIMTVQLRDRLEASLGRELPPTVAFEYPTVEALSAYLAGEPPPASPATGAVPGPGVAGSAALPEELSEDELVFLLAEKLKETATIGSAKLPGGNEG